MRLTYHPTANAVRSNACTVMGSQFKTFHLKLMLTFSNHHPIGLVLLCIAYYKVLPVVKCWASVCHSLNPTARSTRTEWNHTAKLNCITIHAING